MFTRADREVVRAWIAEHGRARFRTKQQQAEYERQVLADLSAASRAEVYRRDGGKCRFCGTALALQPSKARGYWEIAHCHE